MLLYVSINSFATFLPATAIRSSTCLLARSELMKYPPLQNFQHRPKLRDPSEGLVENPLQGPVIRADLPYDGGINQSKKEVSCVYQYIDNGL